MPQTLQLSPEIIKLQENISSLEKGLGKVILERERLDEKSWMGTWLRLDIQVFLRDI